MPTGRPTKYKPEMCQTVIELGRKGKTVAQMALACGISRDTFNEWRHEKPDFSDAVQEALLHAQVWWEEAGQKATFGGIPGWSAQGYSLQIRNRFPDDWAERVKTDVTMGGKAEFEVVIPGLTAPTPDGEADEGGGE